MGLTLYDFRDLDLLLKIEERADNDGLVTSQDIASSLGLGDDGAHNVGSRFGWMRHYGMLERDKKDGVVVWRLAPGGRRVADSHLKANQLRTLEAIPEESMVEVMTHVVGRYKFGDPLTATLLRREFFYGTGYGRPKRNGRA